MLESTIHWMEVGTLSSRKPFLRQCGGEEYGGIRKGQSDTLPL